MLVPVLSLVALFAFVLADIIWLDLNTWDESRLAVNAIEMLANGNRLVPTYGFVPDLWNTKPPLMVNLMATAMQLLGPSYFALRLPSALAMAATVVLLAWFTARTTRSRWTGIAAGVILASAQGFYGYHGGQTGDYDALLTLFTTGYGLALFTLLDSDRRRPGVAVLAGLAIGLAILTKGVAGLVPGVGIALFAIVPTPRRLIRNWPDHALAVVIGIALGGGFYLLRSALDPAYLAAVAGNELHGRYNNVLGPEFGPLYYVGSIARQPIGMLAPLLVALLLLPPGRLRRLGGLAVLQVAVIVTVYSSAATKYFWYAMPAYPWLALGLALAGFAVWRHRASAAYRITPALLVSLYAVLPVGLAANAVRVRYVRPWVPLTPPRAFDDLTAASARLRPGAALAVVDGGVALAAGPAHYAPVLRFEILRAARAGRRIEQLATVAAAAARPLVGSCDPGLRVAVAASGTLLWSGRGCVLVGR
ncbi:ArnT family glycosyltransferase [Sandarakinorhabdus sp. DWP1-3-1]|uniref:ArnT family glycosyltransferase n=1 Tax=Sandarakinorhabdus sp. DWP1-3-1 TaxID=2804627 RepID=UPI003CE89A87